jgi:hypothetical protein
VNTCIATWSCAAAWVCCNRQLIPAMRGMPSGCVVCCRPHTLRMAGRYVQHRCTFSHFHL